MGILTEMLAEAMLSETKPKTKVWSMPTSSIRVMAKPDDVAGMRNNCYTYSVNPTLKELNKKLNSDEFGWQFSVINPNLPRNIFNKVDKIVRSLCEPKQTKGSIEVWYNPYDYSHYFYDRGTREWILPRTCIIIPA